MMRRMRALIGFGVRQPNFQAAGVVLLTLAAVNLSTDPLPAGSEPLAFLEDDQAVEAPAPRLMTPVVSIAKPAPLADGVEPHTNVQPVVATVGATSISVTEVAAEQPTTDPAVVHPKVLTGKWAMHMNVLLIQKGLADFAKVPDYMATFTKQERIGGDLTKVQKISMKLRHEPFSVYMKWRAGETGQQVIYVEGQNDNKMLVKAGGFLKAKLGTLSLNPTDPLAMAQARYPVTMVGLKKVSEQILKFQAEALERGTGFQCELRDDAEFDERPCYRCLVLYESQDISPEYRKSEVLIDKKLSLPVCIRNYTWAKDANPETIDDETLIEHYAYTDIEIHQQFANEDFDKTNESYRMVR